MNKQEYLEMIQEEKELLEIDTNLGEGELFVCDECGSLDIEEEWWKKVNTGEVTDIGRGDTFCSNCQEKVSQFTLEYFLKEELYLHV